VRTRALLLLLAAAAACRRHPAPAAGPRPPADRTDLAPLPVYTLNLAGGVLDPSSDPAALRLLVDSRMVEIAVRPISEVKQPVEVAVLWVMGRQTARWRAPFELGPASTFRWRGSGERPFGSGQGEMVVVLSPAADIPDQVPAAWLTSPPHHWRVLHQPVRWP
jgi:hypothetical protein